MKKIQYLFATIILGLAFTSCLDQSPEGGVLTEEQHQGVPNRLEYDLRGIYTKIYEYGGHGTFGLRSIDMYGDIQCGDMAMKRNSYGWFEDYERGYFYAYARAYIWSYNYEIIHLTNLSERSIENEVDSIMKIMADESTPDEVYALTGYCYGQILALRGWAYANLLNVYCDARDANSTDLDQVNAMPIYTGKDLKTEDGRDTLGAPLSTVAEVYSRVYEDLSEAIDLLEYYGKYNARESKLNIDADVARLILAYAMLNHGDKNEIIADGKNCYTIAQELAETVIPKYPILKFEDLTSTGFANIQATNWLWGEEVTVENSTALGSFFGQVDIHSYSYAAAGDTKGIDSKLYDEIVATGWDARKNWFRSGTEKFPYCPDGKFYSPKYKNVTDLTKVDREWLCDQVFMRVEVAYLIAAEAAWNNGNDAVPYIEALCNERVDKNDSTAYANYQTWLGNLNSSDAVKDALVYNWRVEMWGEGYGLQTLRRLAKKVTLGKNHLSRADAEINTEDASTAQQFMCEIPASEIRYNPTLSSMYNLQHQ